MAPIELLTSAEAARRLGITRQAVSAARRRGSLRPILDVPYAYFTAEEIERYRESRAINKVGRGRTRAISAAAAAGDRQIDPERQPA